MQRVGQYVCGPFSSLLPAYCLRCRYLTVVIDVAGSVSLRMIEQYMKGQSIKKAPAFTGKRFKSSIGISFIQGKKIVFRITLAKLINNLIKQSFCGNYFYFKCKINLFSQFCQYFSGKDDHFTGLRFHCRMLRTIPYFIFYSAGLLPSSAVYEYNVAAFFCRQYFLQLLPL